jgi:hypothetical protein
LAAIIPVIISLSFASAAMKLRVSSVFLVILTAIYSFKLPQKLRLLRKISISVNNWNEVTNDWKAPSIEGLDVPEAVIENAQSLVKDTEEVDYCIIGSGIGGLSCAALLSYYGYSSIVLEAHYLPGGVAHTFERNGFKFDAGPSLWNGMNTKPYNPLREVS